MTERVGVPGGAPRIPATSVYTDGDTITGNGTETNPLVATGGSQTNTLVFDDGNGAAHPGTPLCPGNAFSSGSCFTAIADDTPSANAIGLALAAGEDGEALSYQFGGILELTRAQWNVVQGGGDGLVVGAQYYLSPTVAGRITVSIPNTSGQYIVPIGIALTETKMQIQLSTATFIE